MSTLGQLATKQVNFAFSELALVKELTEALVKMSELKGKEMSSEDAQTLALKTLSDVDINNPFIAHKGIYWLAKQVIE